MSAPVDVRGVILSPGTLVVYATRDRYSGLQFGTVHKIKDTQGTQSLFNNDTQQWERQAVTQYKIQFLKTDAFGTPEYETEWQPDTPNPHRGGKPGMHVLTDKQAKSGYVEIYGGKVLAL